MSPMPSLWGAGLAAPRGAQSWGWAWQRPTEPSELGGLWGKGFVVPPWLWGGSGERWELGTARTTRWLLRSAQSWGSGLDLGGTADPGGARGAMGSSRCHSHTWPRCSFSPENPGLDPGHGQHWQLLRMGWLWGDPWSIQHQLDTVWGSRVVPQALARAWKGPAPPGCALAASFLPGCAGIAAPGGAPGQSSPLHQCWKAPGAQGGTAK